jgi:hypothetical protein
MPTCSGITSGNKEGDVVGTIEWELAGLTDEDGMLKAFLQGYSFTLIPPEVSLKKGKRGVKVSFPIPAKLGKNQPKITGLSWYLTWYKELINTGWQVKDDFKGITNDFLRIAKGTDDQVLEFAKKWGPLWICAEHVDCFMFGFYKPWLIPNIGPCFWPGFESVERYKKHAREVNAVLSIAAALIENRPSLPAHWEEIGPEKAWEEPAVLQKAYLSGGISNMLSRLGIDLAFLWDNNTMPELVINKGFGFLPSVWLEVAQSISRARQICVCDACHNVYIRYGRRPQKGRNNYCPTCRNGYAKQRIYIAKRRRKQKSSNQEAFT